MKIKYWIYIIKNALNFNNMKKLLKVINSMTNVLHIDATRKYIDLYYKQFGETRKDLIEYYFRNKKKHLNN